jgi:hypothetical protein
LPFIARCAPSRGGSRRHGGESRSRRPWSLALGFLALAHARHWTPEPLIDAIGRRLGARFGFCQGV